MICLLGDSAESEFFGCNHKESFSYPLHSAQVRKAQATVALHILLPDSSANTPKSELVFGPLQRPWAGHCRPPSPLESRLYPARSSRIV